jgi:hypothetical protein
MTDPIKDLHAAADEYATMLSASRSRPYVDGDPVLHVEVDLAEAPGWSPGTWQVVGTINAPGEAKVTLVLYPASQDLIEKLADVRRKVAATDRQQ